MTELRAIIIEDEEASRETLTNYLNKYCPNVQIVAQAENINKGKADIIEHNPNLVFLDVEMPYGNGFDLLEQLDSIDFELIFVTAYSNYALKALNMSASYYLLKPIDIEELIASVEKVTANIENIEHHKKSETLNSCTSEQN